MDNKNSKKETRSMYLYTALIFVVAIFLIIIAFFSHTNISRLGNRAEEFASASPTATQTPSDEMAKIANMAAELDVENDALKSQIAVYDNLLAANAYIANSNITEAETVLSSIDETTLTDNQRTLYEQIKNKINEGKEQ